jgi:hypothetical protein
MCEQHDVLCETKYHVPLIAQIPTFGIMKDLLWLKLFLIQIHFIII